MHKKCLNHPLLLSENRNRRFPWLSAIGSSSFSEGLYSSPNKAVEELVSNAFDAGGSKVHVIMSPDRTVPEAFIAVIDDGTGMNALELAIHWLIGTSNKRDIPEEKLPKGRKQIGKFGIGKLATFVLGRYLTHVSKRDDKFVMTFVKP